MKAHYLPIVSLCFWVSAAPQAVPIRCHPANPHYFEFRGQPTILVTSAEHYGAVINADFDWRQYLQILTRDGMNYTRVFVGSYVEGEQDIPWMESNNTLAPRPGKLLAPWARSAVPGYHDGGAKFDLDRWDEAYFKRLQAFVQMASQNGVVVELTLFGNRYGDSQWAHSPLKASNNVQGVGGRWEDFQTLRDPQLVRRQEQMVRKIVTELKDADNVIYEISNEPFNNGVDAKAVNEWHRHIAALIAKEEVVLGFKHLVAANEAIHSNSNVSVLNWHYVANLPKLEKEHALNKPIVLDETNGSLIHAGADDVRVEAWEWLCGGGAGYNNLSWDFTPDDPTGKAGSAARGQLKVLRDFVSTLNFVEMKPESDIISGPLAGGLFARALVDPGKVYWIYLHHSQHKNYGEFITGYEAQKGEHQERLELAIPPGRYRVRWIRPRDGILLREDLVDHPGAKLRLVSPAYDDADTTIVIRRERTSGQAAAKGPLRVHPANPRYFTDGTTNRDGSLRAVYLTGSHTWGNLCDYRTKWPAFDFPGYLDFLDRHHHNFIRLWSGDGLGHQPVPYARTGPGTALDGGLKVDLNRFDPAFFERLRSRVEAARERGLYVGIMLFSPDSGAKREDWNELLYNPTNNVQGINGDTNGDLSGAEAYDLSIPRITACQEAFVRRVVDTVNELDNVLYEIGNEGDFTSVPWQYQFIRFLQQYQAGKPKQHPIGMTAVFNILNGSWSSDNRVLLESPADWISPGVDLYKDDPPAADGKKVIIADVDHIWPAPPHRGWIWKCFLRGIQPLLMDWYCYGDPKWISSPEQEAMRKYMGYTLTFANKINLGAMTPRSELATTKYYLANPDQEYLVYQPKSGEGFSVHLSAGSYSYEWFNPVEGKEEGSGRIESTGQMLPFKAPFEGEAVLYFKAQ